MKITLEGTNERNPFNINEFGEFTVKTDHGEMHFRIQETQQWKECGVGWGIPYSKFILSAQQIGKLSVKTREELAAEQAIQKAKDVLVNAQHSVRAAEHALKVIKESK